MPTMKMTPASVARISVENGRDVFWDKGLPGLGLQVSETGRKAWLLKYRIGGKQAKKKLGTYPAMELGDARKKASEWIRSAAEGNDPRHALAEKIAEPTVADLSREWLDRHSTGLKSERAIHGYIRNDVIPEIGSMKVSSVRKVHILKLVEKKAATAPRAAGQLLTYTKQLFKYAATRDLIPANPAADLEPRDVQVRGIKNPLKQKARKRVLDHDEMAALWRTGALQPLTKLVLQMILVTGQRPGEVAAMHEREITGRTWTIPASRRGKTETAHAVYLTDTALQLLAEARAEVQRLSKRRGSRWSGYIFESATGGPITTAALSRALLRANVGSKIDQEEGTWRPHDLRRTMRTGLSAAGVPTEIAELVVGHTKKGIIAVYDRHAYDEPKRAAWEAWERRLREIIILMLSTRLAALNPSQSSKS